MKNLICFLFLLSVLAPAQAIVNGHEYPFEDQERAEVFRVLANELRCPKCQNQNLADSNAMIADDLRRELYQQVQAGKQSEEIVDFMVDRYGEFVLYRPRVNAMTYFLWYGPAAFCVIAAIAFGLVMRQRRKQSAQQDKNQAQTGDQATYVNPSASSHNDETPSASADFSAEEQARLDALLNGDTSSQPTDKGK